MMSRRLRRMPQADKDRRRELRRRLRRAAAAGDTESAERIKAALVAMEARRLGVRFGVQHGDELDELNRGLTHQRIGRPPAE